MCIWTCNVQGNTLFWCPCGWSSGSHSFIILWDLLIHCQTVDGDVNPFGAFSSAGGWCGPLRMWAIVMFQTACCGFASVEIFISFSSCVTCFWCLSPVWWHCASWRMEYSSLCPSLQLLLFPILTFGPNWHARHIFLWINSSFVHLRMFFVPFRFSSLLKLFWPPWEFLRTWNKKYHTSFQQMMIYSTAWIIS